MVNYSDKQLILDKIEELKWLEETTNTPEALTYMTDTMFTVQNGDRSGIPNAAIVITGKDLSTICCSL